MSINRRHIIQYKPEGVANIFAPIIRVNGEYVNTNAGPVASNSLDFNHVQYPQQSTITTSRSQAQQHDLTNQGFNQIYEQLFSNLYHSDNQTTQQHAGPSASAADSSNAYGLGRQNFESDLASFFSNSLPPQLNCLNSGGLCEASNQCTEKIRKM